MKQWPNGGSGHSVETDQTTDVWESKFRLVADLGSRSTLEKFTQLEGEHPKGTGNEPESLLLHLKRWTQMLILPACSGKNTRMSPLDLEEIRII